MAQDLISVEAFKNSRPATAFAALNPATDDLSEGIGSSYGIIGYKGKVWTLRYRGEKHTFFSQMADGTAVPANYLDVIILRQARNKSKSYYKAYDPNQSDGERPICASLNSVVPDADVTEKQCDTCALCPRNVWKTDANGRKGRECTDYKRLAVLILPPQTAPLLGAPLMESVFLRVPPASLNNLAVMGETMANQGWHFSTYITRISFDPAESHPKMIFKPLQGLTDQEAPIVLPIRESSQAQRITGEDQVKALSPPATAPAALQAPLQAAPAPVQAPVMGAVAPVAPIPGPAATGLVVAPQAIVLPQRNAPATSPAGIAVSQIDTAFASPTTLTLTPTAGTGIPKPVAPASVTAATAQTVADTGEAEASDAALDARIAALMPKP